MPDQIYIGNFPKGQITSRLPFAIDNESFPNLFNMYVWRGRAKRKRGTILLGQLQIQTTLSSVLVGGAINLLTGLPNTATIAPGSISLVVGANTYTEPTPPDGNLIGTLAGSGTINYATGAVTILGGGSSAITGSFSYFPGNPVMGLRDFVQASESLYPLLLAFDTTNAYQVNQTGTAFFYNVTYYKTTDVPFTWSGQDYQQFWTTNYQGALWATNGIAGFNFKALTNTLAGNQSILQTSATTVTIGLTAHGLVNGDVVWINEVTGTIATGTGTTQNQNINGQSGVVTVIDADSFTGTFANANFQGGATGTGGIAEYLTNSAVAGTNGIKWYDGDPTNGSGVPAATGLGWVNFAPPLTALNVSIENSPELKWYLIGALVILPYKDRLLFFNPTIGTSTGQIVQLQDAVIWSWDGTAYYSDPVPANQTSDTRAYYVDQTGLGGYIAAGIDQPITTVSNNEDALLVGFAGPRGRKTRLHFTGDDISPFVFFTINSELPSNSTFSVISLDKGAIDIGVYGIAMTDQQGSQRIDLDIPDSVFQISNLFHGDAKGKLC